MGWKDRSTLLGPVRPASWKDRSVLLRTVDPVSDAVQPATSASDLSMLPPVPGELPGQSTSMTEFYARKTAAEQHIAASGATGVPADHWWETPLALAVQAGAGVRETAGGIARAIGIGSDKPGMFGTTEQENLSAAGPPQGTVQEVARAGAPFVALAPTGPTAVATGIGLAAAGQKYDQLKAQLLARGYSEEVATSTARKGAAATGLVMGLSSAIPINRIAQKIPGFDGYIRRLVEGSATAAGFGAAQQGMQRIADVASGVPPELWDNMSPEEALHTAKIMGIVGLAGAAIPHGTGQEATRSPTSPAAASEVTTPKDTSEVPTAQPEQPAAAQKIRGESASRPPANSGQVPEPATSKTEALQAAASSPLVGKGGMVAQQVPTEPVAGTALQTSTSQRIASKSSSPESIPAKNTGEMTDSEAIAHKAEIDQQHSRLVREERDDAEFYGKGSPEHLAAQQRTKEFERQNAVWVGAGGAEKAVAIRNAARDFVPAAEIPVTSAMGAASAEELRSGPTGIKNAIIDQERERRGMPPLMSGARNTDKAAWDKAMHTADTDPLRADELVDELAAKPRTIEKDEVALLLHRKLEVQNETDKQLFKLDEATQSGDIEAANAARFRVETLEAARQRIEEVARTAGTRQGQSLQARKMLVEEDFTLAGMRGIRQSASEAPLTEAQGAEVKQHHEAIAATGKAAAKAEETAREQQSELAFSKALPEIKTRAKTPTTPEQIAARKQSATEAVKDAGRPEDVSKLAQLLAEEAIRGGTTELRDVIRAVHKGLSEVVPEITPRDAMDAMSGYGDYTPPTKDQIKLELTDVKRQAQQVAKLHDMREGNPPLKTGKGRPPPSNKERRLTKVVNELKKRLGFNTTNPERQLASAMDAMKTRLKNQIADLGHQIETRTKIVKEKTSLTPDAEAQALIKVRDELRKQYDEIFGKPEMTHGQRLELAMKAAERSVQTWETRLKAAEQGAFKVGKKPRGGAFTEELGAMRARRDALKEQVKELKAIAEKQSPDEIANQRLMTYYANRTADLLEKQARGDFTTKPRRTPVLEPATMKAKAAYETAKTDWRRLVEKERLKNRPAWAKIMDLAARTRREFVLSWPTVFPKLAAAAVTRLVSHPLEVAAGVPFRAVLRGVARRAPTEGRVSLAAEAKLALGAFRGLMEDSWRELTKSGSDIKALYETKQVGEMRNLMGQMHAALKAPVKRAFFERSFQMRFEAAARAGEDVTNPLVLQRIGIEAYKDGQRSIFLRDNKASKALNAAIATLESKSATTGQPSMMGKGAATGLKILLPITRVPFNIAAETLQYTLGTVTGSARLARAWRNGFETLNPDEADMILRCFSKGSVGLGFMALGWFNPNTFGGYYQPREKRLAEDVKPSAIRIYGVDIPSLLLHNPLLETLQIGATARRIWDAKMNKGKSDASAAASAAGASFMGVIEQTPMVRQQLDLGKLHDPATRDKFIEDYGRQLLLPGAYLWAEKQFAGDPKAKPVPY